MVGTMTTPELSGLAEQPGAEPANRWKAGHDAAEGLEHVWEAQDLITWCKMSIAHVLRCYVYPRMYVYWSIPHIHPPTKTKKTGGLCGKSSKWSFLCSFGL